MKATRLAVFLMQKELPMTSIAEQAEALQRILEEEAVRLAKETGFIERERAAEWRRFCASLDCGLVTASR